MFIFSYQHSIKIYSCYLIIQIYEIHISGVSREHNLTQFEFPTHILVSILTLLTKIGFKGTRIAGNVFPTLHNGCH